LNRPLAANASQIRHAQHDHPILNLNIIAFTAPSFMIQQLHTYIVQPVNMADTKLFVPVE